jgi:hypothetical protein
MYSLAKKTAKGHYGEEEEDDNIPPSPPFQTYQTKYTPGSTAVASGAAKRDEAEDSRTQGARAIVHRSEKAKLAAAGASQVGAIAVPGINTSSAPDEKNQRRPSIRVHRADTDDDIGGKPPIPIHTKSIPVIEESPIENLQMDNPQKPSPEPVPGPDPLSLHVYLDTHRENASVDNIQQLIKNSAL